MGRLVVFGNVAVGPIAIGNVAVGYVAIGLSAAVGPVAISINSLGLLSLGLNAGGVVAFGAVNALGAFAAAGVNALGGFAFAGVNHGSTAIIAFLLAAAMIVAARSMPAPPPVVRSLPLAAGATRGIDVLVREVDALRVVVDALTLTWDASIEERERIAFADHVALHGASPARLDVLGVASATEDYREGGAVEPRVTGLRFAPARPFLHRLRPFLFVGGALSGVIGVVRLLV